MLIRYLLLLLLFLSFNVFSQNYNMNINLNDGSVASFSVQEIQKLTFDGITNIEDAKYVEHVIKSFKLLQNYPNPFNPSTTIEYEIPKSGNVDISVYDLSGRLVKTLLNKNQQKGNYKAKWDGTNQSGQKVSSGFYFYSIKFENSVSSKKMILIK